MIQDLTFTTNVSGHTEHGLELRGKKIDVLISEADFVSTLFLSLTGRQPQDNEKIILNTILVASIDHGINPASGFVPRAVAASGNSVLTAMASTLLALGPYHGGAITAAMKVLEPLKGESNIEQATEELVLEYRQAKKRVPGYGHAVYKEFDPRTRQLLQIAQHQQLDLTYINIAQALEHAIENTLKKHLVLNIDGCIATLLLTLGIDPIAGDGIFGLARVAGSIAHVVEEQSSGQWVRRLPDTAINYTPKNKQ